MTFFGFLTLALTLGETLPGGMTSAPWSGSAAAAGGGARSGGGPWSGAAGAADRACPVEGPRWSSPLPRPKRPKMARAPASNRAAPASTRVGRNFGGSPFSVGCLSPVTWERVAMLPGRPPPVQAAVPPRGSTVTSVGSGRTMVGGVFSPGAKRRGFETSLRFMVAWVASSSSVTLWSARLFPWPEP